MTVRHNCTTPSNSTAELKSEKDRLRTIAVGDFVEWRNAARDLLSNEVSPDSVFWIDQVNRQQGLQFANESNCSTVPSPAKTKSIRIAKSFLSPAERVFAHTDPQRLALLYRLAFRMVCERRRELLDDAADVDVSRFYNMLKAVRRDMHKMRAFVRFRQVRGEAAENDAEDVRYVAWHRPDYRIVRLNAPFFARRFAVMRWTIFTPHESVTWDGEKLSFGEGVPSHAVTVEDDLEQLWRTYYRAIFNPARVKINAMKKEMPVRHWRTLPEASVIDELLRDAPQRTIEMIKRRDRDNATAEPFVPPAGKRSLETMRVAANGCEGCELHEDATQTVFGIGDRKSKLMLIGEQPGDQEDLQGQPFVGPAGQLLDEAFAEAGVDRERVYLTNAVKHFHWKPQGKRRLHAKPNVRHVRACKPWLEAEIAEVQPEVVLCLGATAAQALLGSGFRVTKDGGKLISDQEWAPNVVATIHPSAILRAQDEHKEAMFSELVAALKLATNAIK